MANQTLGIDSKCGKRRADGFTLIELMITVAIVAILASIATASYQSQIRKSHRTDARTALLDIAGREERYMSVYNTYSQVPTDIGYAGTTWGTGGIAVGSGYYNVKVEVPNPNTTTVPLSYLITATPTNTQTADTTCASIMVDQLGQQTATGSGGNTAASADCWK